MTVDRAARSDRRVEALLDLWVLVPVVTLCWPLFARGGYPFSRDLVFTPRLPLRPEALGLGAGTPRAAPLDAVVGALSTVVDGAVLGRVAVVGVLAVAGWGAHRAVRGLVWPARMTAAAFAVWNPFVVERLGLGQWALLSGYAALFWIVRVLTDAPSAPRGRAARTAPWLALGALTPTGALLVGVTTVAVGVRRRGDLPLLALAALVQLPWLLPAVLGGVGVVSDPAAVAAFAGRAERAGPAYLSLLGLGGIWDAQSVPGSRAGWLGHLTVVVVVTALVVAARSRRRPPTLNRRVWALGAASLFLAGATSIAPVASAASVLMDVVPGLGLVRDAQKWLAPFVVLCVLVAAVLIEETVRVTRSRAPVLGPAVVVLAVAAPFVMLPDGAVVVHRVLTPVDYPSDFDEVASAVGAEPGILVSVPWRLYRAYPWATAYATYDPSSRWFDTTVVTSDDLVLGDRVVRGESPYAAGLADLLATVGPGTPQALAGQGVRWVLVHRDDPDAAPLVEALTSDPFVTAVAGSTDLLLLRLADTGAVPGGVQAARWTTVLVTVVDVGVLLVLLVVSLRTDAGSRRHDSVTVA